VFPVLQLAAKVAVVLPDSAAKPLVEVGISAGIANLRLDSPPNRNALSRRLMAELLAGLEQAIKDDTVRVIVLSHTGTVFCSGADLAETSAATSGGSLDDLPLTGIPEVLTAFWSSPKPVIARVGGPARAGGLGLLAACDLAIAAHEATFAFTEVRLGLVPAVISAVVIPRLSSRAASEFLLTGNTFDGRRAAEIGLVTAAVPAAELDTTVASYAAALCRGGPLALTATKRLLQERTATTAELTTDLAELTAFSAEYFRSPEGKEGVAAFREKRPPAWVPAP
jgi:methylglutaconyl-CoA hydratase